MWILHAIIKFFFFLAAIVIIISFILQYMMAKFNSENNPKSDTITGTVMTIAYFYRPVWQFSFINHGECYWRLFTGLSGRQPDSLGRHLHFMDILYLISNNFITYLLYLAGWNTHDIHSGNLNNTLAGKKKP